mmetsp:Transcript_45552/g.109631  ORF Transcript_45552/g.109631 Transcript_45552/m.109631 type:complete len:94 (-) Transcript_45552:288-569(-)
MAAAAGGTDELAEARGKLRAVEEELVAAKAGGDAQVIAKAELVVAEAKLGVANRMCIANRMCRFGLLEFSYSCSFSAYTMHNTQYIIHSTQYI